MNDNKEQSQAVATVEPKRRPRASSENRELLAIIERVATNPDVSVEKMKAVLDMKEHLFDRQSEIEFNEAMARVQARILPVVRDADNDQTSSRYARLETIVAKISPIYTAEGFALSFNTAACEVPEHKAAGWFKVVCDCTKSGWTKRYQVDLPPDIAGIKGTVNKTPIHGYKSTLSYGRNMLICMIFNVVLTNEDNDGNVGKPAAEVEELINDEELGTLVVEMAKKGLPQEEFCKKMRITQVAELPAVRYQLALNMLNKTKARI